MPSPLANFFMKALICSPLHPLLGRNFAVITVTGRKTGRPITTPVNTLTVGGVLTVISQRERTWWRNLRGGKTARLQQGGKRTTMRGDVKERRDQVVSGLKDYFAAYPAYAKYFKLDRGPDGQLDPQRLETLAGERVIIQLFPE